MSQNQWHIVYLGAIAIGIYLLYTIVSSFLKKLSSAASNLPGEVGAVGDAYEQAAMEGFDMALSGPI